MWWGFLPTTPLIDLDLDASHDNPIASGLSSIEASSSIHTVLQRIHVTDSAAD
jgi:hypothetical protein